MSLLIEDAPAWQPTPISELSDFQHWPFNHVLWVSVETVMRRGHMGTFWQDSEPLLVDHFSPGIVSREWVRVPEQVRLPILGNWTQGIPITIQVHTEDDWSPFWIFRHHYYCWRLNWMMRTEQWKHFVPEPHIRHGVVEDFLSACKRKGLYLPHEKETRWFPKTWRNKPLPEGTPILGEQDQRWKGDTFALYRGGPLHIVITPGQTHITPRMAYDR